MYGETREFLGSNKAAMENKKLIFFNETWSCMI